MLYRPDVLGGMLEGARRGKRGGAYAQEQNRWKKRGGSGQRGAGWRVVEGTSPSELMLSGNDSIGAGGCRNTGRGGRIVCQKRPEART